MWRRCFEADPLNADAGRRWCRTVLQHGGARDPARMLREMLAGAPDDDDGSGSSDPILELVPVVNA